jgi:ribonuclease D
MNKELKTSDWNKIIIYDEQKDYAAVDGVASIKIYNELARMPDLTI